MLDFARYLGNMLVVRDVISSVLFGEQAVFTINGKRLLFRLFDHIVEDVGVTAVYFISAGIKRQNDAVEFVF